MCDCTCEAHSCEPLVFAQSPQERCLTVVGDDEHIFDCSLVANHKGPHVNMDSCGLRTWWPNVNDRETADAV